MELTTLERIDPKIPIRYISQLGREIRQYEEKVNKCEIHDTNTLAYDIGADINYLKYSTIITEQQKKELESLKSQFINHIDKLKKCKCIKKIEK